jgi:hypothetical protein
MGLVAVFLLEPQQSTLVSPDGWSRLRRVGVVRSARRRGCSHPEKTTECSQVPQARPERALNNRRQRKRGCPAFR